MLEGLTRDRTRTGGFRWFYQRKNAGKKQLRHADGSPVLTDTRDITVTPEVNAAYLRARAALEAPEPDTNARTTIGWLIGQYLTRRKFGSDLTLADHKSVLSRIRRDHGNRPYAPMNVRTVNALRDEVGGNPGNKRVRYLRQMFDWAIEQDLCKTNPAKDAKKTLIATEGHTAWTREDVLAFEDQHPIGTKARLAFALFLYTGQRVSDVAQWGPLNVRQDRLVYIQHKGRTQRIVRRSIPVAPPLLAVLEASEIGATTWLETDYDKPFSIKGLGNRMRKWCDEAGLQNLSAHGIRKATGNLAAERGCTSHQIMEILGVTLKVAEDYTRAADKIRLADTGFARAFGDES